MDRNFPNGNVGVFLFPPNYVLLHAHGGPGRFESVSHSCPSPRFFLSVVVIHPSGRGQLNYKNVAIAIACVPPRSKAELDAKVFTLGSGLIDSITARLVALESNIMGVLKQDQEIRVSPVNSGWTGTVANVRKRFGGWF